MAGSYPPPRQRGRGTTLRSRVVEGAQDLTRRKSLRDVQACSLVLPTKRIFCADNEAPSPAPPPPRFARFASSSGPPPPLSRGRMSAIVLATHLHISVIAEITLDPAPILLYS